METTNKYIIILE